MNGERLHRHICLEYHRKPSLGRMSKGVFHCRTWEKASRRIIIRLVLLPGERMSITLSPGGSLGELGTWALQNFINRDCLLIPPSRCLTEFCLSQIWLDPLICRPWLAFCRLFSPTISSHTSLLTISMPSFRPTIDLIKVLSNFLPLIRRTSRIHKSRPSIDRAYRDANFISSLALAYQFFLTLDLIVLFLHATSY